MNPNDHQWLVNHLEGSNTIMFKGLVLHHSAIPDRIGNDIESIKRFHSSFVFNDRIVSEEEYNRLKLKDSKPKGLVRPPYTGGVGYHLLFERRDGNVIYEIGRPFDVPGAHAKKYNSSHMGICFVGNYSKVGPDEEIWKNALEVCRIMMGYFEFPRERVIAHRETYVILGEPVQKDCPGSAWPMDRFRSEL